MGSFKMVRIFLVFVSSVATISFAEEVKNVNNASASKSNFANFEELQKVLDNIQTLKAQEVDRKKADDGAGAALGVLARDDSTKDEQLAALKEMEKVSLSKLLEMDEELGILQVSEFQEVSRAIRGLRLKALGSKKGRVAAQKFRLDGIASEDVSQAKEIFDEITRLQSACPSKGKVKDWQDRIDSLKQQVDIKARATESLIPDLDVKIRNAETQFKIDWEHTDNDASRKRDRQVDKAKSALKSILKDTVKITASVIQSAYFDSMAAHLLGMPTLSERYDLSFDNGRRITRYKDLRTKEFTDWFGNKEEDSIGNELYRRTSTKLDKGDKSGAVQLAKLFHAPDNKDVEIQGINFSKLEDLDDFFTGGVDPEKGYDKSDLSKYLRAKSNFESKKKQLEAQKTKIQNDANLVRTLTADLQKVSDQCSASNGSATKTAENTLLQELTLPNLRSLRNVLKTQPKSHEVDKQLEDIDRKIRQSGSN